MNSISILIKNSVEYLFSDKNIYKDGMDHIFINFEHNINLIDIINELIKIIPTSYFHPCYKDKILIDIYNGKEYVYWIYNRKIFKLYYNEKQIDYPAYILIECIN